MSKRGSERKFPVEFRALRRVQTIRCACGEIGENPIGNHAPGGDDLIAGHFRSLGWDVDSRYRPDRHLCPTCAAGRRPQKPVLNPEKVPEMAAAPLASPPAASPAPPPSAVKSAPRPDLVTAKLDATMLLGDHYDVHAKNYRPGYSDERVAKESGAPVEWVRRRREDDFGPLPPPAPKIAIEALAKVEAISLKLKARAEVVERMKDALINLAAELARDAEAIEALRRFLAEPAAKEQVQ